ncbi:MAG: hypothetical protein GX362_02430 [Methanosarcinaceae archaeon]|nr:hypothetical protein [Methanosarcinaceae archaeon]
MPHRCTKCGATFDDGDSVILTGCPNCKWNKFFYVSREVAEAESRKNLGDSDFLPSSEATVKPAAEKQNTIEDVLKNIDSAMESEDLTEKSTIGIESIKIIDQGSYEVNLESVLKNEEIVVGFKEGQYAIDLPAILSKSSQKNKKKK